MNFNIGHTAFLLEVSGGKDGLCDASTGLRKQAWPWAIVTSLSPEYVQVQSRLCRSPTFLPGESSVGLDTKVSGPAIVP